MLYGDSRVTIKFNRKELNMSEPPWSLSQNIFCLGSYFLWGVCFRNIFSDLYLIVEIFIMGELSYTILSKFDFIYAPFRV